MTLLTLLQQQLAGISPLLDLTSSYGSAPVVELTPERKPRENNDVNTNPAAAVQPATSQPDKHVENHAGWAQRKGPRARI
jgi:hypothetical protein